MPLPLAEPRSAEELYLARGEEVSRARPVLTGDVYADIDIGPPHDGFVLLIAHPCSMRGGGGRLRTRIAAAPIRQGQEIPLDQWPEGNFNLFPLPDLFDRPHSAALLELGAAPREALEEGRRIASLSDHGIYVLQQRLVHSLTRVVVGLDTLEAASGHVLAEAELEEEWVEQLAGSDAEAEALRSEVSGFQAFFNDFRADFKLRERRADIRRTVREEIRARGG